MQPSAAASPAGPLCADKQLLQRGRGSNSAPAVTHVLQLPLTDVPIGPSGGGHTPLMTRCIHESSCTRSSEMIFSSARRSPLKISCCLHAAIPLPFSKALLISATEAVLLTVTVIVLPDSVLIPIVMVSAEPGCAATGATPKPPLPAAAAAGAGVVL